MTSTSDLRAKSSLLEAEIKEYQLKLRVEKKKLITIEDSLIENKEKLLIVKEEIRRQTEAEDFDSLRDRHRDNQIAIFQDRLEKLKT